jgi:hypothetical protein
MQAIDYHAVTENLFPNVPICSQTCPFFPRRARLGNFVPFRPKRAQIVPNGTCMFLMQNIFVLSEMTN